MTSVIVQNCIHIQYSKHIKQLLINKWTMLAYSVINQKYKIQKKEIGWYLIRQTYFLMFNKQRIVVYLEQLAHTVFSIGITDITLTFPSIFNAKVGYPCLQCDWNSFHVLISEICTVCELRTDELVLIEKSVHHPSVWFTASFYQSKLPTAPFISFCN